MKDWMRDVTMDTLPDAHRKIAEVIGVEATLELCDAFGGISLYIPMTDAVYNEIVRNKEIRRRYLLGAPVRDLASQYKISDRSVLRIVDGMRPNQTNLFDCT